MRIAVVGSGIAGLGATWQLSRRHEVVLFEAQDRLGGHTHSHRVALAGREYDVDTGFIVFNSENYPLLTRMFGQLGVATQPTTMGFSVHDGGSGLEYNASSFNAMFCQRRNLLSPAFLRMLREIFRFYRECPALLELDGDGPTLGDYLAGNGYSRLFAHDHLLPMASALWSSPASRILDFPAKYLVRFMANHRMLQAEGRPEWRVVRGGSSAYLTALAMDWAVQVRLDSPVTAIHRGDRVVTVRSRHGDEAFDHVVLGCHADDALALLSDPSPDETSVLGAIRYQDNDTILHTDARMLPRRRAAWAAWNAYVPPEPGAACTVSYCMNILQSLDAPVPLVVSLNRGADIAPDQILARINYRHPVYDHASVSAQARRQAINGVRNTWFAGAYWGFGFHEDGLRSGIDVAEALGVRW
jgi:predicted NAD/FAD-binding protein